MIARSKISWTDFSGGDGNFVLRGRAAGDCEVSPGCANCYAGAILRRSGQTKEHTTFNETKLRRLSQTVFDPGDTPFRRGPGSRPLVFVCDMGDLFHDAVSDRGIKDALLVMAGRHDVDWQVLTKRADRLAGFGKTWGPWPDNIWVGVTCEDQERANLRIPLLLKVPAKVRFLSCEPLLGPITLPELTDVVDVSKMTLEQFRAARAGQIERTHLDWIIVGGESGPMRRPFNPDWARRIRDDCAPGDVPFFYKQGSSLRPGQDDELDGVQHKAFPSAKE